MNINWFPGHMHKAIQDIRKLLPEIDVVIELLDARIPYSSQNPVIRQFGKQKAHIKLLNKSDLADPAITELWINHFNNDANTRAMAIHHQQTDKLRQIIELCHKLVPARSGAKPIQALITGIPNVGKSTLINQWAGRVIAKTGNEPAITKAQQRIKISDDLALYDSPGILWAKFENQRCAYRLATTGAIKDTAISHDDIGFFAVEYLLKNYPHLLIERYKLVELPSSELAFLDIIGRQRGCLAGGGVVDLNQISKILLNELRSGKIGLISLETPAMAIAEEEETRLLIQQQEEEKAARKAERLAKHKKKK